MAFQKKTYDEKNRDILWGWLMSQKVMALVAVDNNKVIAFALFREQPYPLLPGTIGFLDDLFVSLAYRGHGVANKLIEGLKTMAHKQNWLFIRWFVLKNNYRAKGFYDKLAKKTMLHTYQLDI